MKELKLSEVVQLQPYMGQEQLLEVLRALDDAEPAPATADRAESRQSVHRKQRKRAGGMLALLKSVDPGKKRV